MGQEYFAYLRSIYEIPYAKQIAEDLGAKDLFINWSGDELLNRLQLTPLYEARYRGTDRVIREILTKQPITQVLELGGGFSPFGLIYSQTFLELFYLEVDQPEITERKAKLIKKLVPQPPPGYYLISANYLDHDELEKVVKKFNPHEPLLIYHVGILSNLRGEDKNKLGEHIHDILSRSGGYWVTPDPSIHNERRREIGRNFATSLLAEQPGDEYFPNEAEADRFFDELDFSIEKFPQLNDDELVSPAKLNIPTRVLELLIENIRQYGKVWKLSP